MRTQEAELGVASVVIAATFPAAAVGEAELESLLAATAGADLGGHGMHSSAGKLPDVPARRNHRR